MAIQPDGKIVVASVGGAPPPTFKITRLNPDGSPDAGFGAGGTVTPDFGAGGQAIPRGLALAPNGKIVVVGFVDNGVEAGLDIVVVRLLANGQPDPGFDPDGIVTINLGESDFGEAVAMEPDGRIVVTGGTTAGPVVLRLSEDGTPDPSFNGGAPLPVVPSPGGDNGAWGVVRLPNGSYVLGLFTSSLESQSNFALARVTSSGALDGGFSDDGIVIHDFGGIDDGWSIAVQPDGKLVVAGGSQEALSWVARFTSGGALDGGFGNGGRASVDLGGVPFRDVAVQANGKLLAFGGSDALRATVMRVQPGGTLDTTFNGSGLVSDVFGGTQDGAGAGALQANGGIVAAGQTGLNAVVARLQGDSAAAGGGPAASPGGGGPGGGPGGPGGPGIGSVPRCAGKRATIVGTARSDRLKGTRRADVIVALGGNDRVAGGGGKDLVCGGGGDDRLEGGAGNDRLFGQSGRDALGGAGGSDLLDGGSGNDALGGGPGSDRLLGQAGRDRLTGGPGKGDRCAGNAGRDRANCERGRA